MNVWGADFVGPKTAERMGFDNGVPSVFIVDGDAAARQSLERLIRTAGWEPEPSASAEEFLSRRQSTGPCCVIVDLPGVSGLELQRRLAGRADMPIVFLASHTDVPVAVQAMKAGAVEVLVKPFDGAALLSVIETAIERSRAALRHDSQLQALKGRYATLTRRERDVMALVVTGLLNKLVAGRLGISEITVKAHRGRVMRKMKADSLPDLVTMAMRLGLPTAAKH